MNMQMSILKKLFGGKRPMPQVPLTFASYAKAYADSVRTAHPGLAVTVMQGSTASATRVSWTFPDGLEVTQFMGNWYARYLREPGEIAAFFAGQLDEATSVQARSNDATPTALTQVLPVIKTVDWQYATTLQLDSSGTPEESHPLAVPLVGSLVLAYVEDMPDSMDYVSAKRMAELQLDAASLHALALENLLALLPQLDVQGGDGRYAARLDRNYDASMVLLLDRWKDRLDVVGDPVIAIAARDDVLLCGSGDAATVESLRSMAATIASDSPYGLASELFVWHDGRLQALAQLTPAV